MLVDELPVGLRLLMMKDMLVLVMVLENGLAVGRSSMERRLRRWRIVVVRDLVRRYALHRGAHRGRLALLQVRGIGELVRVLKRLMLVLRMILVAS